MKLKKGSQAAKDFMAKIRAKKGKTKNKISGTKKTTFKPSSKKKAVKKTSLHKDTKSHNVKISVMSENLDFFEKNRAEYAKYNHLCIYRSQRAANKSYALYNGKRITLKRAYKLADEFKYISTSTHYPYVITDFKQLK